nr:SJCHGC03362 protein [Schistosoma japonicum]
MSSTSSSSTTQAQPIFPPMPPVFMPPFMGMPIVYPGNLFNGNTSMPEPPSGLPESTDEARLRASAEARFTALRQINILLNAAVLQMNAYLNAASAPSSESESMTSVLKADNFESKIEEEKVSSDDVNSQLGSDDKNIPTSANLELPEIRKHRLAHFKSSPSDINSQSNSELTNESK